jgi:hypothetical protein
MNLFEIRCDGVTVILATDASAVCVARMIHATEAIEASRDDEARAVFDALYQLTELIKQFGFRARIINAVQVFEMK